MTKHCENHRGFRGYARLKADCEVCQEMAAERGEKRALTFEEHMGTIQAPEMLCGSSDVGLTEEQKIYGGARGGGGKMLCGSSDESWKAAQKARRERSLKAFHDTYQPPAIEKSRVLTRSRGLDGREYAASWRDGNGEVLVQNTVSDRPLIVEDTPIPYTTAKAWCPTCGGEMDVVAEGIWSCPVMTADHPSRFSLVNHEVWRRWGDTPKVDGDYWMWGGRDGDTPYVCPIEDSYAELGVPVNMNDSDWVLGPLPRPKAPK